MCEFEAQHFGDLQKHIVEHIGISEYYELQFDLTSTKSDKPIRLHKLLPASVAFSALGGSVNSELEEKLRTRQAQDGRGSLFSGEDDGCFKERNGCGGARCDNGGDGLDVTWTGDPGRKACDESEGSGRAAGQGGNDYATQPPQTYSATEAGNATCDVSHILGGPDTIGVSEGSDSDGKGLCGEDKRHFEAQHGTTSSAGVEGIAEQLNQETSGGHGDDRAESTCGHFSALFHGIFKEPNSTHVLHQAGESEGNQGAEGNSSLGIVTLVGQRSGGGPGIDGVFHSGRRGCQDRNSGGEPNGKEAPAGHRQLERQAGQGRRQGQMSSQRLQQYIIQGKITGPNVQKAEK